MKQFLIFVLLLLSAFNVPQARADVVTSTLDTSTYIDADDADTNFFGNQFLDIWGTDWGGGARRSLIRFTTPAELGTINSVSLFLYSTFCDAEELIMANYVTTEPWVDDEVTWNDYSIGNPWTTPGGDFGSIGGINVDSTCTVGTWQEIVVSDPITWGTTYSYLLKRVNESGGSGTRSRFESAFNTDGHLPYFAIDYTAGSSTPVFFITSTPHWSNFTDRYLWPLIFILSPVLVFALFASIWKVVVNYKNLRY